jgi:hypothetical protein
VRLESVDERQRNPKCGWIRWSDSIVVHVGILIGYQRTKENSDCIATDCICPDVHIKSDEELLGSGVPEVLEWILVSCSDSFRMFEVH